MIYRTLNSLHRRNFTAWVMITGILLYPVLSFLTTPWVGADARGHTVVLCTLKGLQEVYIDSIPGSGVGPGDEVCPALALHKIIATARLPTPVLPPELRLYVIGIANQAYFHALFLPRPLAYFTRAPPIV